MPTAWQNLTDLDSPPCSPQMPTLRPLRVGTALLDAHLDELADAALVEADEGVVGEDRLAAFLLGHDVIGEEAAGVVAGQAEGHLGEVVRAEGEELRDLGDLVGEQGGAGDLDHRAHHVVDLGPGLGDDGVGDALVWSTRILSSFRSMVRGIMISGSTVPPAFATSTAASMMAVTCMSRISG